MSYLKRTRARVLLACFLLSSVVLVAFSDIDIAISRLFFDHRFYLKGRWWETFSHHAGGQFIYISLAVVVGIYAFNRRARRNACGVDGKRVAYLVLVLALGAGLLVNGVFKDNFGRARPRDVQEFGGSKHFTPAFVIAHECRTNCSFASGEAAGAFFSLALALALSKKRRVFVIAAAYGAMMSGFRIASGAHFFSDSIVSFFIMLIAADALYHYMLRPACEAEEARAVCGAAEHSTVEVEPTLR